MFDAYADPFGAPPVLDLEGVCKLLEMSRDELMVFIPGAIDEIAFRLALVDKAMMSGNLPDIALHCHTLKSVTASIGAPAVEQAAAELEHAARNHDSGHCAQMLGTLKSEAKRLNSAVSRL